MTVKRLICIQIIPNGYEAAAGRPYQKPAVRAVSGGTVLVYFIRETECYAYQIVCFYLFIQFYN